MIHSIKEIDIEKEIMQTEIIYPKDKVIISDREYIKEICENKNMCNLKKTVCILIAIYYKICEIIYITLYFYFLPSMSLIGVILYGNS